MGNDKPTVKIGIMSFAHMHAESYARCLKKLPDVEFVGVSDDDPRRGRRAAKDFGVEFFKEYDQMLESDIDAVIVCSENSNHRKHVVYAAQHEKHVLCEKPLAATMEDADAIVEVCRRSGVKLQMAFPCRFHSAFRRLKESVDAGDLGDILAIKATNQGQRPKGWFTDLELSGGGAVMDHTVHVVDLMRCLIGSDAESVYAEVGNGMFGKDYDDTGMITVGFGNGVFASVDCSWSRPKIAPFWGNVKMDVIGEKGVAGMDMFAQKIELQSDKSNSITHQYWGDDLDLLMIESFVRCVAEDQPVYPDGNDGVRAVEVALGAYESAKSGQVVELPM